MQRHFHFVFAHGFERAFRQAHIGFSGFHTGSANRIGDVGIGYGAEQAAVYTGFLSHGDGLAVEFFLAGLRIGQNFGLLGFQLGAARFKLLQVGCGGALGFAAGDQKVAGVAVFHGYHVTQVTQAADFF